MNQTFSVTIDVPAGWECTGEYRAPIRGEAYLRGDGLTEIWDSESVSPFKTFILCRAWMPPSWLPIENWLYFNGRNWRVTNRLPRQPRDEEIYPVSASGATVIEVIALATVLGQTWTPPPNTSTLIYQI